MRRPFIAVAVPAALAGIAIVAAGCGGGSGTQSAASGYKAAGAPQRRGATVMTWHTSLGTVLVDGQGRTLYLFEKDKPGGSSCDGACASVWPPLTTRGKTVARGDATAAKLGTVKRADGTTEVTYAGHPLYTYAGDAHPGDLKGQGLDQFGAEWHVLAPSGDKIDED
jgi:predicted lipoprotein with Yx(FWY)xxD motif